MAKLLLLFEDDWEIGGDGRGQVIEQQLMPVFFLLRLAQELPLRFNFMAEAMQQVAMSRYNSKPLLAAQASFWTSTVQLMLKSGHDVQLHIHPQWHELSEKGAFLVPSRKWNLAAYPPADIECIVSEAERVIGEAAQAVAPQFRLNAYKAGSWALQPSLPLLDVLRNHGIRYVIGPGAGICFNGPEFRADWSNLEEPVVPYYPRLDDAARKSPTDCGVVIFPIPYVRMSPRMHLARLTNALRSRVVSPADWTPHLGYSYPPELQAPDPMGRVSAFRPLRTYEVCDRGLTFMRAALDQVFARYLKLDRSEVPVVLQMHTKGFIGNFGALRALFQYMCERYRGQFECLLFRELPDIEKSRPFVLPNS
ncbi:MAG TPA: hypothetical protein VFA04_18940 [Bryobacteraceae bacterium]|nr:hypothetical protein [Bryobacteraceae bacterium]